jgi:hypothetical protein
MGQRQKHAGNCSIVFRSADSSRIVGLVVLVWVDMEKFPRSAAAAARKRERGEFDRGGRAQITKRDPHVGTDSRRRGVD